MTFPREFELLLASARLRPQAARLRELASGPIDWGAFLALAACHGVRPLVYQSLTRNCWDLAPADVQREWRAQAKSLGRRSVALTAALLRITAAFDKEQIPVVALKGPALAQEVYGSITLREFDDLDLLVRPADFGRAEATLERLGYRAAWDLEPATKLQFLRYQGETWFAHVRSGLNVDLHWRVAPRNTALPLEAEFFWPRFRSTQIAGRKLLGFAPEDLALYLAAQGGHDAWSDLRRLCDLAVLVGGHPELDWDSITHIASRLHGSRVVLLGLHLAAELLAAPLPGVVQSRIADDREIPALAKRSLAKMIEAKPLDGLQRSLFQIQSKESLWDKARLVFGTLSDRTYLDGQWIMLPRPLWPLYRALRPLRQLVQVVRSRSPWFPMTHRTGSRTKWHLSDRFKIRNSRLKAKIQHAKS